MEVLIDIIDDICRISDTTDDSVNVFQHGETIFINDYGHRDVEARLQPNEKTIYYLVSMSKAFTAAEVGILVEQQKLQWETPDFQEPAEVHTISIPTFKMSRTLSIGRRTAQVLPLRI